MIITGTDEGWARLLNWEGVITARDPGEKNNNLYEGYF